MKGRRDEARGRTSHLMSPRGRTAVLFAGIVGGALCHTPAHATAPNCGHDSAAPLLRRVAAIAARHAARALSRRRRLPTLRLPPRHSMGPVLGTTALQVQRLRAHLQRPHRHRRHVPEAAGSPLRLPRMHAALSVGSGERALDRRACDDGVPLAASPAEACVQARPDATVRDRRDRRRMGGVLPAARGRIATASLVERLDAGQE